MINIFSNNNPKRRGRIILALLISALLFQNCQSTSTKAIQNDKEISASNIAPKNLMPNPYFYDGASEDGISIFSSSKYLDDDYFYTKKVLLSVLDQMKRERPLVYSKIKSHGIEFVIGRAMGSAAYSPGSNMITINSINFTKDINNDNIITHEMEHKEMDAALDWHSRIFLPSGKLICMLFDEICAFSNERAGPDLYEGMRNKEELSWAKSLHEDIIVSLLDEHFLYNYFYVEHYASVAAFIQFGMGYQYLDDNAKISLSRTDEIIDKMLRIANRDQFGNPGANILKNNIPQDVGGDMPSVIGPKDVARIIWNRIPKEWQEYIQAKDEEFLSEIVNLSDKEKRELLFYYHDNEISSARSNIMLAQNKFMSAGR